MSSKALRTRTGCGRCRSRRKKCDGTKPVCNNRSRWNLSCTWTTVESRVHQRGDLDALIGLDKECWPPPVKITRVARSVCEGAATGCHGSQGYPPFRNQTQFDLTVWSPIALRGLISPTAGPDFEDLSGLLTMALQNDWLRDALAAFSAYSLLTMGDDSRRWEEVAVMAYQNALPAVRSHIHVAGEDAKSLETLVAVTFLGLSESLGTGDAPSAITHFSAASSICRSVPFPSIALRARRKLYGIAVECWLYNLATLSFFYEDCDSIPRCTDWGVLDGCSPSSLVTTDRTIRKSPFLGASHGIYKLMLHITCFARKRACLATRRMRTSQWSARLDDLQSQLGQSFVMLPEQIGRLYRMEVILHIYACRIFTAKVADHDLTSCCPIVLDHLKRVQETLRAQPTRECRGVALAGPLIVFLCAAGDESMYQFFVRDLRHIYDDFDGGHARRMNAVLTTIRRQRMEGRDGLDLLLRRRGILVTEQ